MLFTIRWVGDKKPFGKKEFNSLEDAIEDVKGKLPKADKTIYKISVFSTATTACVMFASMKGEEGLIIQQKEG